jgi:hypothetical protein
VPSSSFCLCFVNSLGENRRTKILRAFRHTLLTCAPAPRPLPHTQPPLSLSHPASQAHYDSTPSQIGQHSYYPWQEKHK